MTNPLQSPCKDCEERHIGCHSSCERYELYQAKLERARKKRTEENALISRVVEAVRRKQLHDWRRKQ